MEETQKRSGWKIFFYLTPVYILVAIPMVKWTLKNNSNEVDLSKDAESAFNSSEGEIKKANPAQYNPDLTDIGYSVRYRSGGTKQGTQEELEWGYKEGYLTQAVRKNFNDTKALDELFNNQWVVRGFMSRAAAKKALSNPQALQDFLENTSAVKDFLADPVVKSVLASPQVLGVLAGSDLAKTLLAEPAVQGLIKNYESVESVVESNPGLTTLFRNPGIKKAVMADPLAAPLARALGWK